ncbi:hypothetical protein [Pseudomonas sp. B15(2017)]|uniref:hypothetical protein n=1 Tax=Pseudomonas sp. B15(2017) TaxID=1981744 RepID=UPI000A1EBAF8|nr:hypothetical protein [Pseudomonas sp. B15(2017)]
MSLHERQRHYDRLHHEKRLEGLASGEFQGLGKHSCLTLENGSRECLRLILDHGMSTNSVDLNNVGYMAELDEFAATTSATTACR